MPEVAEKVLIHAGWGRARLVKNRISNNVGGVKRERRCSSADLIETVKGVLANANK
jgi:hypothetical protein